MTSTNGRSHWLSQYANDFHRWRSSEQNHRPLFYRPLGFVEAAFDSDGIYHEGRADITARLELLISSKLSQSQLRRTILLAWTALRLEHVLLMSKAVDRQDYMTAVDDTRNRFFVIFPFETAEAALDDAGKHLVFAEDYYEIVEEATFARHAQNVGRVIDSTAAMAKLFVLPLEKISDVRTRLRFAFVMGHQISDGLTNYTWLSHFLKLLNTSRLRLTSLINTLHSPDQIKERLPIPQEDHYPRVPGSSARKRWFWVLTLVLRHVRKPQPAAFPNPLSRREPLTDAVRFAQTYSTLLDYSRSPPLNTFTTSVRIPLAATRRLHRLCREAGASIGAGCFVLVAMVMMSLYESRYPSVPLHERLPFIGSFPLNPRPFFNHASPPNSLMLAFSDGVVLPFLPSSLDVDKRFRLLVRQAHRQLSIYQKRTRVEDNDAKKYMSSRGAGRLIAMNYIAAVERTYQKLPPPLREKLGGHSPQGELKVRPNPTMATCGVSSVGRSQWKRGLYNLDAPLGHGEDAFRADYRSVHQSVRARDGEFLVGISGDEFEISANVSFDGNVISEELVGEWKKRMEALLAAREAESARL